MTRGTHDDSTRNLPSIFAAFLLSPTATSSRTLMNAQSLPNELLLPIFRDVVDGGLTQGATDSIVQCLYLSQVCRRWRAITISHQEFWEVVPQKNSELTGMFLTRCLTPRIVIDVSRAKDETYRAAIRLVLVHFERAKSLEAGTFTDLAQSRRVSTSHLNDWRPISTTVTEKTLFSELMGALCRPKTRRLVELKLAFSSDRAGPLRIMIPDAALQGVETLRLSTCRLSASPRCRLPSGIRSLELVDVHFWTSVLDVVQFLRAVPQLECFSYRQGSYPNRFDPATLPEPRCVRLERLRSLHLAGAILDNYATFSCLSFPPTSSLVIEAGWSDYSLAIAPHMAFLARIKDVLRDHFSAALERGSYYNAVGVYPSKLSGIGVDMDLTGTQLQDADVLPVFGHLSLSNPNDSNLYHRSSPDERIEMERATREAVFALPIFTQATTLVFEATLLTCLHSGREMMSHFTRAEVIQLRDSADLWEFYTVVRQERVFPEMRCVRFAETTLDERVRSTLEKLVDALRTTYADVEMRLEVRRCWVGRKLLEDLAARMHPWRLDWDEYKKEEMPDVMKPGLQR